MIHVLDDELAEARNFDLPTAYFRLIDVLKS